MNMAATDRSRFPLGLVSRSILSLGTLALLLSVLAGTAANPQDGRHPAELVAQLGHRGGITSVAFSPDGGRIVSGGRDHSIRVWDAENGEVVATLISPGRFVTSVVYSPDGRHIVSGDRDNTVRVWDTQSGKENLAFEEHTGSVYSVAYSPDGKYIASGGWDDTVRVRNAESGEDVRAFTEHAGSVYAVAYSPDGAHIASGGWDDAVRVRDAESGENQLTLTGHAGSVYSVAYSPDGQRIVSGSADNTIRVWLARSGEETRILEGHTDSVTAVAYSPDGQRIVSGSEDNTVRIWDSATGDLIATLDQHEDAVTSVAYSPDGRYLASGSDDLTLRVWNAEDGTAVSAFRQSKAASISAVGFSSNGANIAVAVDLGRTDGSRRFESTLLPSADIEVPTEILLLDGRNATPLPERTFSTAGGIDRIHFSPDGGHVAAIDATEPMSVMKWNIDEDVTDVFHQFTAVAYSPDGEHLAAASADGTIRIVEIASRSVTKTLVAHRGAILSLEFSPDGKRIAFSVPDDAIHVWDVESGEQAYTILGPGQSDLNLIGLFYEYTQPYVSNFAYSPDGTRIATAGLRRPLKVWAAEDGKELLLVGEPDDPSILSLAYSPDGEHIATGGFQGIEILDASTGERVSTVPEVSDTIVALAYSPDGKKIAARSISGKLVIWDFETQEALPFENDSSITSILRRFQRRLSRDPSNSFSYHPDGTRIATADRDQVRIWDTTTGKLASSRNFEPSIVTIVDFSSDGRSLAFGSVDWTLVEWEVATDEITTYPFVEDWVRPLAQASSECVLPNPAPAFTAKDCTSSHLVYGTANGAVVLSETADEEIESQDAIVFQVLPFGEWITYRPSDLTYLSSSGAESQVKVRFDDASCGMFEFLRWTHCPLYPLEWYREELRRSSERFRLGEAGTPQAIEPKEVRLATQMAATTVSDNPVAVVASISTLFLALMLLHIRWHRNNPLVLARTFFLRTHWNPTWMSRRRALRLRSKVAARDGTREAYVVAGHGGVRGATPSNLERYAARSKERLQAYVIYPGSTPRERTRNLDEVLRLKFDLKIDVVPLEVPTLQRGLMNENCDSILSEVEMLYLSREDPYADSMPIKDPNFFFGRQERLEELTAKIADGQHVGIFGLRKTGKTSLAMRLLERFRNIPIIMVSCQGLDSTSSDAVLAQIARRLRDTAEQLDPKAAKSLKQRRNGLRSEIEDVLIWWQATGRSGPCVVVLDEIEELYPVTGEGENRFQLSEGRKAFNILRSLAQEYRTLSLVLIGYRPDINRLDELPWNVGANPMFMSVNESYSGFLSHDECAQMLRDLGAWKQIEWQDDALDYVFRQCGGHPFITRMFASAATKKARRIDALLVRDTARRIRETMRNNQIGTWYGETFDSLPDPERNVLSLIAKTPTPLTENDIPRGLVDALTNLENYNLVCGGVKVEFASELLAHWMNTRTQRR